MPGHTTKFGVGDVVWLLHGTRAMSGVVKSVYLSIEKEDFQEERNEAYGLRDVSTPDSDQCTETRRSVDLLFPTRQALLESL